MRDTFIGFADFRVGKTLTFYYRFWPTDISDDLRAFLKGKKHYFYYLMRIYSLNGYRIILKFKKPFYRTLLNFEKEHCRNSEEYIPNSY